MSSKFQTSNEYVSSKSLTKELGQEWRFENYTPIWFRVNEPPPPPPKKKKNVKSQKSILKKKCLEIWYLSTTFGVNLFYSVLAKCVLGTTEHNT